MRLGINGQGNMNYHKAGLSAAAGRGSSSGTSRPASRMALIVAASPVSRIVIGRTIERIYLRSDAVAPNQALEALQRRKPVLMIIDEPLDNTLLEPLLSEVIRRRRASESQLPRVILIADPVQRRSLPLEAAIDAVVYKPITPDALQPLVERLMTESGA